jgi:hypothetical protein
LSSYNDAISGAPATQDFWYKYDSQNRFVLTMGQLSNGVIGLGANGVQIGYDVAGQRRSASYADGHSEAYDYTSDGYLEDVRINGVLRSRRGNDLLGRVQNYSEYADNGSTVIYNKASQFDADNRLLQDTVVNSPVGGTATTTITKYDYRLKDGNGNYTGADQGVVTHSFQYDPSKAAGTGVHTDTSYVWWDEAKQSQITLRGTDPANPNAVYWKPGLSDFTYDVNGHVKQVHSFNEGTMSNTLQNAKTLTYTSDQYGQVLRRDMMIGATLGLTQRYYYLNGQLIGDISNNGPTNISYAEQLAQRGNPSGNFFRYGKPVASADFDQNYQPINADYPGASASSYTAKDGDTLSSIARAVWGDSTLWYLIADANGLTNGDHIVAGQVISIPNKVSNFHNTASTFRVYNPGQAIGDTLPYLPTEPLPPPPPSADGGCGGFVQMIALVVAIVVTIYTAGAAAQMLAPAATVGAGAGATTVAGASVWSAGIATVGGGLTGAGMAGIGAAAIGGAVGALASQAIMISGGQQNGFNWSGVAMGAVGAGVTAGIGAGTFSSNGFTNAVVSGAVRSTATQGLGVATGLQSTFDWRSVAISAISSGSAYGASAGVHDWDMGKAFEQATRGTAAGIVSTLMRGGGVGKNIGSIAGDVIASTIGNAVVDQMTGASTRTIDFEAATRQYEADIVNGRMQLLADSTSVKNSPDRLLNGPSIMSTDADDGIDDGWQKVEITEKRLTSLEKLASYAQDIKDFLTTPDYNQLSDQQLARLPVSNFAANREKVNRAAAQGTIPYTMGGVVSDFAYKTASAGVSAVMTAPVAGYVATRVGVGYLGRAITGGAAGGVFNTTQQLLDNAVHVLSGGEVGRSGFSTLELSTSTFLGVGLGVAAKGVPEVWAWAKEKIVVNATLDAQAAFRTNFVGPTIGRSGFLSTEELSDSVFGRYQQFTDVAYQEVLDAEASGALRIRPGVSRNTIIGQRTDRIAQSYLDTWIQAEQIPDGFVNINKYLRDPAGTGAYRIPDVRVPSAGQIFDGTIGFKWNTTSQIIDFSKFSGGNRITIVRPTIEGGSYSIP